MSSDFAYPAVGTAGFAAAGLVDEIPRGDRDQLGRLFGFLRRFLNGVTNAAGPVWADSHLFNSNHDDFQQFRLCRDLAFPLPSSPAVR